MAPVPSNNKRLPSTYANFRDYFLVVRLTDYARHCFSRAPPCSEFPPVPQTLNCDDVRDYFISPGKFYKTEKMYHMDSHKCNIDGSRCFFNSDIFEKGAFLVAVL